MHTSIIVATVLGLSLAGAAGAREIADGKLQVRPFKDTQYKTEMAVLGKAEFFGYVGDYVADKKITGILLKDGAKASNEQKHVIAITAQAQHIDAFVEIDGKEGPLVDPIPSPAAVAAPAVDDQHPVATPTETHG